MIRRRLTRICAALLILVMGMSGTPNLAGQPAAGTSGHETAPPPPLTKADIRATSIRLPLRFEANRGQVDPRVDFVARGGGYAMLVMPQGLMLTLQSPHDKALLRSDPTAAPPKMTMLGLHFVGANLQPAMTALGELPGKVNYYIGNDEAKWLTAIPTYARVKYSEVYPGIDLVYYGNQQQLEYDFVVAPGHDPNVIAMAFAGADTLALDATGDLLVKTAAGQLRQHKPVIYQQVDGVRKEVAGRYRLDGQQARFEIGAYDPSKALVIDPILAYSTFFGGDGEDPAYSIAVDPVGNIYLTGVTNSMSSPPGAGNFPIVAPWGAEGAICCGGNDTGRVFVSKLNPTGTAVIYSSYLGGYAGFAGVHQRCPSLEGCSGAPGYARGWDTGHSIGADSAGNAYVVGWAESLDFPTTADAIRGHHPGPSGCIDPSCYGHEYGDHPRDAFVAKFDPAGALTYSSLIGGRGSDGGMAVAVMDSGPGIGVYVGGLAQSPDFFADDAHTPPGGSQHYPAVNAFQPTLNVNSLWVPNVTPPAGCIGTTPGDTPSWLCWRDAFVMRLTMDLKTVVWSTLLGGTADDGLYGITVSRTTGEAVVVGETESTDFPSTANALQPCLGGNGGYHADPTLEPAPDTPFPCHLSWTPGVGEPTSINKPNVDAFFAKFSPAGVPLTISYLGGSMDDNSGATLDDKAGDFGRTVALDDFGNIYITGWTESTTTPVPICGPNGNLPCPHTVPFTTTLGSYMHTLPQDPTLTCGPGAPSDCIPPYLRLHASAYVTKLAPTGTSVLYSTYLGGYGDDAAFGIAVDSAGQAYVTGVGESTNFPGTANGTIPGFPNVVPTNHYITHPNCPTCGGYLNGILPPYNPDLPPQASDGFIVKLNAAGNALIYSSFLGGSGDEVIHGIVHSTRAGMYGIYLSGLSTSQDISPPPPPCPPGTDPCPPPPPVPWHAFPVTADAFQPLHAIGRTIRCDGGPPDSQLDDYPCPPLPSNPSEDAIITRLNDAPDEFPAPPVGGGGITPTFLLSAAPNPLRIPVNQSRAFTVTTFPTGGFSGTITLDLSSTPSGLTITPTTGTTAPPYPGVVFTATSPLTGTYAVTITGTSGSLVVTTTLQALVVTPDFTLTPNNVFHSFAQVGGSGTVTMTVTPLDTFSGTVGITHSSSPPGLLINPSSAVSGPPGYPRAPFTMTATSPGTYTAIFTGTSGALVHTAVITVTARPPDFRLTPAPSGLIFSRDGGSGAFKIRVTPIDGFTGTVRMVQRSAPSGLLVLALRPPISGPPNYPAAAFGAMTSIPNVYTVTITGTSGTLVHTTTVPIIVPFNTTFRNPTANTAADSAGNGNGFEVNPTNAYTDNGQFAADMNSGQGPGGACDSENRDSHRFYNYGFSIPISNTITGMEVRLDAKADSSTGSPKMCVQLSWDNGTSWTAPKATGTLTTNEVTYILGGAGDTWGRPWSRTEFGDANFQVKITNTSTSTTSDFFLDWVGVKVHYRAGGSLAPSVAIPIGPAKQNAPPQKGVGRNK